MLTMNMEASLGFEPCLKRNHFALPKSEQDRLKGVKGLVKELFLRCVHSTAQEKCGIPIKCGWLVRLLYVTHLWILDECEPQEKQTRVETLNRLRKESWMYYTAR